MPDVRSRQELPSDMSPTNGSKVPRPAFQTAPNDPGCTAGFDGRALSRERLLGWRSGRFRNATLHRSPKEWRLQHGENASESGPQQRFAIRGSRGAPHQQSCLQPVAKRRSADRVPFRRSAAVRRPVSKRPCPGRIRARTADRHCRE